MIGYVTLGTNQIDKAAAFYDSVLATIGAQRFMEMDGFVAWSRLPGGTGLCIARPSDGLPASVGNGTMAAIQAVSKEEVEKLHAKALELGAQDEGAVGYRGDSFYAGYFRDLDGNKLNVFYMPEPE